MLSLAGPARAQSPIDGVYLVYEGTPTGQGLAAAACRPTPMRELLAPDAPSGETAPYRVQVTAGGGRVTFSQEGSPDALFSAPLEYVPPGSPDELEEFHVRDLGAQGDPAGYQWVDGRFLISRSGGVDVHIVWQYPNSPADRGPCQTEIIGSRQGASNATTGPATGPAAGPPVEVLAGVGGIAIVVIGGYVVWRRRPRQVGRVGPKVSPTVPPQCRDIATVYDDQVQVLTTLQEAEKDLREQLERAEKIHRNNLIKARMVVNLEIISVVGGSATDLALALRPAVLRRAGPGAIGQKDTWKPPGSMSARWADRIRAAETAAREAWGKLQALREGAAQLLEPIEQRVREMPAVKNARQMWEFHMNRLGEMMADLPKVNQLRTELSQLDAAAEAASTEMKAAQAAFSRAQAEASAAETAMNMARNELPPGYHIAQKDLQEAEQKMTKLAEAGVEDTVRLGRAQETLEAARDRMDSAAREAGGTVGKVSDLERGFADASARAEAAKAKLDAVGKTYDTAVGNRQKAQNVLLSQYNDLTSADVDSQGKIAAEAQREFDAAQAEARQQFSQDLRKKQHEAHAAEVDAASAQGQLDDLRAQAEADTLRSGTGTPTDQGGIRSSLVKAIWWASAPIRYPLQIAGEIVFGVGQSPQEIVEILLQGRTNIQLLHSHLGAVSRAVFDQQRKLVPLRRQLEACIKGGPLTGVNVPAESATRAA